MIIHVAADLCCGHHRCVEVAPQVYRIEDGFNACDGMEVPPELESLAEAGAQLCPESAITLTTN